MPVYIPSNRGSGSSGGATSISGAYTKAEADLRFVHINGNETINGVKTFTGNISANADVFLSDGIPGRIVVFDLDKSLISSLYTVNSFALSGHTHTEYVYASDVSNITGNLQSQITTNLVQQLSTDSLLQQQINTIAGGFHLVFTEQFTGNGVAKNFVLTGAITNAQFISGGWNVANVLNALDASVTDINGKAIYDAGLLSLFTRHRVYVDSITGAGVVNLDYPPQDGQVFKVWYWYNVAQTDKIDNYYREDYVAKMEENDGDLSTNIKVNTVYFSNILSFLDTDVQKALQTIDQNVPSFSYVNSISGNLYSLIYSISGSYIKSLNSLTGDINVIPGNNISISTSGNNIVISSPNYSGVFVDVSGDTMTGGLSVPVLHLQNNNLFSTAVSGDIFYYDDGEGLGLYAKVGNYTKQLDFDSNTAGPIEKIVLTDNGNGTINAPSIICYLYSNSAWSGTYRHYHIPPLNNITLTDNSVNYLVANYNNGSPEYQIITNPALINNSNIALVATMSRFGNEIHWIAVDWGLATSIKLNNRQINIQRFERSSGLILGETAGRIISISSGVIWYGASSNAVASVSSSGNNADFWYISGGNWNKTTVSSYNNSQAQSSDWLNLVTLSSNDYTVNWIYRYLDGAGLPKIAYVLGQSYANIADAKAALIPNIPTILDRTSILVGRIIVRNGHTTAVQIDSAFSTTFAGSVITDHNGLGNLQGGGISGYYHLSSEQYADFIGKTEVAIISGNLQTQINNFQPASTGVVTVNGVTGNVSIIGTDGISVVTSGSNIVLSSVGGSISGNLDHNELIGLQGGNTTERYHLSQKQYTETIAGLDTTFSYSNGNLYSKSTSRGMQIFIYNIDGSLASISGTGDYSSKTFTYDASGNLTGISII